MFDVKAIGDQFTLIVRDYVSRAVAQFEERFQRVESAVAAFPAKGEKGDGGNAGVDGRDGKDGAPGTNGRDGVDGRDGKDGQSVDPALIESAIKSAIALIPTPKDGRDGKDGADGLAGKDGANGRDGTDGTDADAQAITAEVLAKVTKAFDAIPVPKDGKDGAPGERGADGAAGRDGKDGASVDEATVVAKVAAMFRQPIDGAPGKDAPPVDVEKIALDVLSRVPPPRDGRDGVGKQGEPGQRGADGFGIDDFDLEMAEDGRTVVLKMRAGDRIVTRSLRLDVPIYKGVWRSGQHDKGDTVTYGGSLFIAKAATIETPGSGSPDWQLCVKKGNDGK